MVASVCLGASVISLLSLTQWQSRYSGVETGLLVVDATTLALFIGVALKSNRFWPLWVAGLQLTTSMGHLMKAIDVSLLPTAYGAALRLWSYPILIILAIGTWRGQHRPPERAGEGPVPA